MDNQGEQRRLITPLRVGLVLIVLAVLIGVGLAGLRHRVELGEWAHEGIALVQDQGPIPFFAALAVLPAVGMPVSVFYLAAGAVFPLGISVVGTAIGLAINISLTYWMARKWFRSLIERLLKKTRFAIPAVAATDHVRVTLFLRLMPGPPFFLQSYILGLIEVPFTTYFLISWMTQVLIATGFIVLGSAFYSSSMGRAVIAVVIVVLVTIIIQWVRRYLAGRQGGAGPGTKPLPPVH